MKHGGRLRAGSALVLALIVSACGDDSAASGGNGASGGGGAEDGGAPSVGGMGGAPGGGDASGGGGSGEGGGSCIDTSGFGYVEHKDGSPECLDAKSASSFCGFASDEAICAFSVDCGNSDDIGQCKINCEQGSSSFCNPPDQVECVAAAYCAADCAALEACTFIL